MASELETLRGIGASRNPIQERRYQELSSAGSEGNPFGIESPTGSYLGSSGSGFDVNAFLKANQARQDALTAKQAADTSARFAQGKADVSDYMTRYNATVPGLYNEVNTKYDVPFWAQTANAIKNRIDELRGNTNNVGAGGYASAGQVEQGINTNLLPRYAQATGTYQTAANLAQNEYGARIAPFETESKLLTERLAREATGYNAEQQRELDSLISQMTSGATLGSAAMARATALADQENRKLIAEEGYANQLEKTRLINERVKSLGKGGGAYVDENGIVHTVAPVQGPGGNNGEPILTPPNTPSKTPPDYFTPIA